MDEIDVSPVLGGNSYIAHARTVPCRRALCSLQPRISGPLTRSFQGGCRSSQSFDECQPTLLGVHLLVLFYPSRWNTRARWLDNTTPSTAVGMFQHLFVTPGGILLTVRTARIWDKRGHEDEGTTVLLPIRVADGPEAQRARRYQHVQRGAVSTWGGGGGQTLETRRPRREESGGVRSRGGGRGEGMAKWRGK